MFVISSAHGSRVSFCLPERGEEKDAPCMPKSGQAFEVPDAQNSGIVNLVLYYQTSFPGLLNVSGKLPTYPYIYIYPSRYIRSFEGGWISTDHV